MIKYNEFEKKLLDELNFYGIPEKGKNVVVGLSGGADSVSLLVSLTRIKAAYPLNISALHLNHMLRGDEAERDMKFAEKICDELSVPFFAKSVDVKTFAKEEKKGIEEAAREVRYKFFNEFSEKNQIDYILTAHNMNDVAETTLFHIIRGSGITGLVGINRRRDNIIRPLLNFSREEIEKYCGDLGLNYVTDSTNTDVHYARNYIRHIILPEMKKLNPNALESLKRLSDSAYSVSSALESFDKNCDHLISKDLDDELLYRRAKKRFSEYSSSQLTFNRLSALKKSLQSGEEKVLSFPDNIECVVKNGDFAFRKKSEYTLKIAEKELILGENIISDDLVIEISKEKIEKKDNLFKNSTIFLINCDTIEGALRVRSRNEGDTLRIGKMTKSIKKQFIDKKIPKEFRDLIPIIVDDNDILCVPTLGVADKVKSVGSNNIYIGIHSRKGFFIDEKHR